MWTGGNRHMWKMQYTYGRFQASSMGLQILSNYMEKSWTTNKNKVVVLVVVVVVVVVVVLFHYNLKLKETFIMVTV